MSPPVIPSVVVRFGDGAGFGPAMVLGEGLLGTAVLGTTATEYVNLSNVQRISIRRGRDRQLDNYAAGSATIQFLDVGGLWNPTYTASPYGAKVRPFNQIQIKATYSATEYYLFTGYVVSWDYDWQPGTGISTVTIEAVDAFRLLALANVSTVPGTAAGDTPGTRLTKILDEAGWPESYRDIDTGEVTLQADTGSVRSALEACQQVEQAELGALFTAGNGNVTFLSRNAQSVLAATDLGSIAQFADYPGGTSFQTIDVRYDDTDLANVVSVTRAGGTTQTVTNTTSIDTYYQRNLFRDGLILQTDTQALQQANAILNYRDEIEQIVDSITVNFANGTSAITQALGLELCDPVYIVHRPVAGPDLEFRTTVQRLEHEITAEQWITTIGTALPLSTAFILDSSEFGILGTSTL